VVGIHCIFGLVRLVYLEFSAFYLDFFTERMYLYKVTAMVLRNGYFKVNCTNIHFAFNAYRCVKLWLVRAYGGFYSMCQAPSYVVKCRGICLQRDMIINNTPT